MKTVSLNAGSTDGIELKDLGRIQLSTGVLAIAVDPDGDRLFAATIDGSYRVNLASGASERIGQHDSWCSGIALVDEHRSLFTTGYDGKIQLRRLGDPEPKRFERVHPFWSWKMAVSPDRSRVVSVTGQYLAGSEDYQPRPADEPTVKVFDAVSGETLQAFSLLPPVQCAAFSPDGQRVAAANLMGDVQVWDVTSGKSLAQWRTPDFTSWGIIKSHCFIGGIHAIQFSADGTSLYVAGMGEMRDPMAGNGRQLWQQFDLTGDQPQKLRETEGNQAGEGLMETLAMHPSGDWFVMAGRLRGGEWNVGLFDCSTGQRFGMLNTGIRVTHAQFSLNGETLFLAGMKNQPGPDQQGKWPDFGIIDRYRIEYSSGTETKPGDAQAES